VLGIGIKGPARDKWYLNPLLSKHYPLKESTAMSKSVEERSKEEEEKGTLQVNHTFIFNTHPTLIITPVCTW
jgi:hypothetical protein